MVSEEKPEPSSAEDEAPKVEHIPLVTYLLLARHGENEWVTSGKLAGRTPDVHLNDKGRQQAEALAKFLAIQPISAVYSSPLERCVETATPLAAALGLPVEIEPALLEVDYGDWQGIELKEAAKLPEWVMVQHFPGHYRFPAGEGLRQAQQRAIDGLDRIVAAHPDQVVALYSHGDIIRTLLAHYIGVPLDLFQRIQISTGSVSTIAFFDGRPAIVNMNVLPEPQAIKIKRDPPQPHQDPDLTSPEATESTAAE